MRAFRVKQGGRVHGLRVIEAEGREFWVYEDIRHGTMGLNAVAAPTKYPAGFFGVFTGSYDLEAAYCRMTAAAASW